VEAITQETGEPTDTVRTLEVETPGLRPAPPGLQPVRDLAAFLQALPDFGEEADRLREAVAESRAERRLEAERRDC
jgi:hypothetical protein